MQNDQAHQAAIANYLLRRSNEAFGNPRFWVNHELPSPYGWTEADVDALVRYLRDDSEFELLRLGTWLATPPGHVVAAAVEQALPPLYRPYAQLFVAAISRAAELQAAGQWQAARKYALGGVAIGVVATVLLGGQGS